MFKPTNVEVPGPGPSAARRIIEFARDVTEGELGSPCDQDRAIGKQCCGVIVAGIVELAGAIPMRGGWIVEFRAPENTRKVLAACD